MYSLVCRNQDNSVRNIPLILFGVDTHALLKGIQEILSIFKGVEACTLTRLG